METSLHRALKLHYAQSKEHIEVRVDGYRIDAVFQERLVEIQHGSLAAIRDKVRSLLTRHDVLVVKPIIASNTLVKQDAREGKIISRRRSPKQGKLLDVFDELVHFMTVFPDPRLTLEVLLVDIEEWRYPGHGRRRRWRNRDFQVQDQTLVRIRSIHRLATVSDLCRLLPARLPRPFHTGHLADSLAIPRWQAQRIAYCLRSCGAAREIGKSGNTRLYELRRLKRRA